MNFVTSCQELDALLQATIGWVRAEIHETGIVLRLRKGMFRTKITIRQIALRDQVIVLDHDSLLVDVWKFLPGVRDRLKDAAVRLEGRTVYLDGTRSVLARAQVEEVSAAFHENRLELRIRLRQA